MYLPHTPVHRRAHLQVKCGPFPHTYNYGVGCSWTSPYWIFSVSPTRCLDLQIYSRRCVCTMFTGCVRDRLPFSLRAMGDARATLSGLWTFQRGGRGEKMAVHGCSSSRMQENRASVMVLSLWCLRQVTVSVYHFESGVAVMGSWPLAVSGTRAAPWFSLDSMFRKKVLFDEA